MDLIKWDPISDAWLGIGDTSKIILDNNALIDDYDYSNDDPGLFEVSLLKRPQYLGLACKIFLNVELLPMQAVILEEMWKRPFPLFIANRGAGKATGLETPVLTNRGWIKNGSLKLGDKIYGRDGKLHNVTGIYPQGKKQICRLTLLDGRTIDCCEDHLWVVRGTGGKERVLDTKTIIESGVQYDCPSGSITYKHRIPNCEPIILDKKELPLDPYLLGCLLGDGCMTTLTPKIASNDDFIIDQFRKKLPTFEIKRDPTNNNYTIVDRNKEYSTVTKKNGNTYQSRSRNRLTNIIKDLRLNVICKHKFIPDIYKYSSVEDRLELVRGLIDTDGAINKNGSIEFTNTCERLVDDLVSVLRSLGITCKKSQDNSRIGQPITYPHGGVGVRQSYFRVFINTSQPIAKLPRKLERIKKKQTSSEKYVSIVKAEYIDEFVDMQCISVDSPDNTYITKDYIVTHNTFLLGVYALLRSLLFPDYKIVIAGAAFRQSKLVFSYMESIWNNAPILRSICNRNSGPKHDVDRWTFHINGSETLAIPVGTGQKIRGLRANTILADEFASQDPDIYETVIAGFGAVSSSPLENLKLHAQKDLLKSMGLWTEDMEKHDLLNVNHNQSIISGTASYYFNHFFDYWKKYKQIINSKGDLDKLEEIFHGEVPENFNWRDFSVIRIPYELIPKGFMSDKIVARAKATVHSATYSMEYGAIFAEDSDGFFKRSLIERRVASQRNINDQKLPPWCITPFDAVMRGISTSKYVYGIDPASERDNFAIVILELFSNHRRVVNAWSINRESFKRRVRDGLVKEEDYYQFCIRKIRDLMLIFPCERIGIDAQGGGIAIQEGLQNGINLLEGESRLWEVIDEEKPKDSDDYPGLHILEMIQFASAQWTSEANHGLRKDLETGKLLFPRLDPVSIELAIAEDKIRMAQFEKENPGKKLVLYDTLEDCVMEIEDLKTELSTIQMSRTGTGVNSREKWSTPETKLSGQKKAYLRKDRYSALLIANMIARNLNPDIPKIKIQSTGGLVTNFANKRDAENYTGPNWYIDKINNNNSIGIVKK